MLLNEVLFLFFLENMNSAQIYYYKIADSQGKV